MSCAQHQQKIEDVAQYVAQQDLVSYTRGQMLPDKMSSNALMPTPCKSSRGPAKITFKC